MQDATISLAITSFLKHDLIVGGGWRPSARWRDAPDASGRLTSFSVEGRKSRRFREVAGVSLLMRRSVFAVDISTVDSQVT